MKNSPFTRARYARMISEAEQYIIVDAVKAPGSNVSVSPQEFSSSLLCSNSLLSAFSLASGEWASLLGFPIQFSAM